MISLNATERVLAGAMSGTSADGVDVAIVRVRGRGTEMSCRMVHHHHRGYDALLRQRIFQVRRTGQTTLSERAQLAHEISLAYAAAINEALLGANMHAQDLSAIAAHGQTFFHDPPMTIQLFDPSLVAGEVGCAVVSDFRRADCAAGGQGAPLVPFADYVLFRDPFKTRVLLNIGGIANLTYVPAGGTLQQVIAFDTGPGNCLSDHLMRQASVSGPGVDLGGKLALRGTPDESLVYTMLHRSFFLADPPKTTDTPSMIHLWEDTKRQKHGTGTSFKLEDELASVCLLTARAIAHSFHDLPRPADELIVSGGGALNMAIMNYLKKEIACTSIVTADQHGIDAQAKEALAFALLGAATLDGVAANVPNATGAQRAVILGSITPKP